jgi:hypothetical protein
MKRLLFFLMAFIGVGIMSGQVVDTTGISDPVFPGGAGVDEMVEIYQVVYGALVILFGYVAKFFGWKIKNQSLIFTIIAGGIVIAGAFVLFGFGNVLPLVFAFLGSIGFYNVILNPLGLKVKKE